MFSKKELTPILSAILIISTLISLTPTQTTESLQSFLPTAIIISTFVILINIVFKKITAFYLDSHIEIELWQFKRIMFATKKSLIVNKKRKNPIPAGFIFPILLKFLTLGMMNWLAILTFNARGTIYRTRRKYGKLQYPDTTEKEIAIIAFVGIIANLAFASLAIMTDMLLFAKINLIYAFFNSIPLSNLDGSKMFFGENNLWKIALALSGIGFFLSFSIPI